MAGCTDESRARCRGRRPAAAPRALRWGWGAGRLAAAGQAVTSAGRASQAGSMAGMGMGYPTRQAGQPGHGNYQHGREGRVGVAARHEAGRGGGGWAGAWGAGRARSSAEVVAPAGGAA